MNRPMSCGELYYLDHIGNDPINEYLNGVQVIGIIDRLMEEKNIQLVLQNCDNSDKAEE